MDIDDMVRSVVSESDESARAYFRQRSLSASLDSLVQARRHAGLTQAQIAERMGTTQSAIARMERDDDGGISLRRVADYAIACDLVLAQITFVSLAEARAALAAASDPAPDPAAVEGGQ